MLIDNELCAYMCDRHIQIPLSLSETSPLFINIAERNMVLKKELMITSSLLA